MKNIIKQFIKKIIKTFMSDLHFKALAFMLSPPTFRLV